jgi:hypothetical protein
MGPEVWSAIANWVVAFAAAFAAWTAHRGLSTWRDQNLWQTDNQIAQRLINDVYEYRDTVFKFRRSYLSIEEEKELNGEEIPSPEDFDRFMNVMRPVIIARFEDLSQSVQKFRSSRRDALFHWGSDIPSELDSILDLYQEIGNLIESYYISLGSMTPDLKDKVHKQLKEAVAVLSVKIDDKNNRTKKLVQDVNAVEDYLRKKIGRRP